MRQNTRYTKALAVAVPLLLFVASLRMEGLSQEKIVWQPTNGPSSASVSALVVNAAGAIFVGTEQSGAFRSTDNGQTWTSITGGLAGTSISALAINAAGHLFAGTSNGSGSGFFRSTDQGETWTELDLGLDIHSAPRWIVFNAAGHIFAWTAGGCFGPLTMARPGSRLTWGWRVRLSAL